MNASLALPRLRQVTISPWLALLLLPVIPFLPFLGTEWSTSTEARIYLVETCTILGAILALALPRCLRLVSWPIRKEIEQIRAPWIASLFLMQMPLLNAPDGADFAIQIFFFTCVLIAAIPFGTEFHLRTLSQMLSQPVERRLVWRRKMLVLAGALLIHGGLAALSLGAYHHPVPGSLRNAYWLIPATATFALATVPWWSLHTRGVLPGIVFSIAAPGVVLAFTGLTCDTLRHAEFSAEWFLAHSDTLDRAVGIGFGVLALAYAGSAFVGCRRRWIQLESPDLAGVESASLFGGRFGTRASAGTPSVRRTPLAELVVKECRLQTVTWFVVAMVVLLALVAQWGDAREWSLAVRETLRAAVLTFAPLAVLMAGATSIAEERRLGTLDMQVLLPVSRAVQWWIKLGIISVLAGVMALCVGDALSTPRSPSEPIPTAWILLSGTASLVAVSLLASSASASALRAILGAVAILVILVVGCAFTAAVTRQASRETYQPILEAYALDPTSWIAQANALSREQIEEIQSSLGTPPQFREALFVKTCCLVSFLPACLALWFSWRNFVSPTARRLWLPVGTLLAVVVALVVSGSLYLHVDAMRHARKVHLLEAWHTARYRERIPPSQLRLARHFIRDQDLYRPHLSFMTHIWTNSVGGKTTPGTPGGWAIHSFSLPLRPDQLELLVRRGHIPDDIRQDLAVAAGIVPGKDPDLPAFPDRPLANTPFGMSPELMRRYGLGPRSARQLSVPPPPAITNIIAPTNTPPPPSMSPELMRRYGLIPKTPPPPATPPPH